MNAVGVYPGDLGVGNNRTIGNHGCRCRLNPDPLVPIEY